MYVNILEVDLIPPNFHTVDLDGIIGDVLRSKEKPYRAINIKIRG